MARSREGTGATSRMGRMAALAACALVLAACAAPARGALPQEAPPARAAARLSRPQEEGAAFARDYGVFVGLDREARGQLAGYRMVVIDASFYTEQDVADLHDAGQTVYSYLNAGSLEDFRDYYEAFESCTLGPYENWPGERWADVSDGRWRDYLTGTLAAGLAEKGVDGLFLDNFDVYDVYPRPEIYDGLMDILDRLGNLGLPLMLNGGDTFVAAALDAGEDLASRVAAVNQECVFTSIDFDKHSFGAADGESRAYFQAYLARCSGAGLAVYLTEYAQAPSDSVREIGDFCRARGYRWYVADSAGLGANDWNWAGNG